MLSTILKLEEKQTRLFNGHPGVLNKCGKIYYSKDPLFHQTLSEKGGITLVVCHLPLCILGEKEKE